MVSEEVDMVSLPGVMGRFAVLKNHAPLISALSRGVVEYETSNGKLEKVEINGGVAEVKHNKIRVLTE